MELFQEYVQLGKITFHRSSTPAGWIGQPLGISFSDGSDKSYGAVVYFRWEKKQGIQVRLVESKAKLTPLDPKGEPVKAEICGAIFAARLRKYIEKYSKRTLKDGTTYLTARQCSGPFNVTVMGTRHFLQTELVKYRKLDLSQTGGGFQMNSILQIA